jgi:predicted transcriptional regulator
MELVGTLQIRIMHILWSDGAASVAGVREALNRQTGARQLAYTTVQTVLRTLERRRLVRRDDAQRTHRFMATVDERTFKVRALRDVREHLCQDGLGTFLLLLSADDTIPDGIRQQLGAIGRAAS